MIAIELDNLRLEHGIKKGKTKAPKKPKNKTKAKKVPGMAFCKNRDPRDMLAELIEAGICKKLLPCSMKDFIGEANLIGSKYFIFIIIFT
jgi:hypothetical protein